MKSYTNTTETSSFAIDMEKEHITTAMAIGTKDSGNGIKGTDTEFTRI